MGRYLFDMYVYCSVSRSYDDCFCSIAVLLTPALIYVIYSMSMLKNYLSHGSIESMAPLFTASTPSHPQVNLKGIFFPSAHASPLTASIKFPKRVPFNDPTKGSHYQR